MTQLLSSANIGTVDTVNGSGTTLVSVDCIDFDDGYTCYVRERKAFYVIQINQNYTVDHVNVETALNLLNGQWILLAKATGSQGFQGFQGTTGNQGAQGNQGLQGNQGFQGASIQGPQGYQGSQGNQGLTGTQGFIGVQGNQGRQGANFQATVISSGAGILNITNAPAGATTFARYIQIPDGLGGFYTLGSLT